MSAGARRRAGTAARAAAVAVLLLALVLPLPSPPAWAGDSAEAEALLEAGTGSALADCALAEYLSYDGSDGEGYKYITWYTGGAYTSFSWCATFLSYCCEQVGLEAGTDFPGRSSQRSVSAWKSFFKKNTDAGTLVSASDSGFTPQAGDIALWSGSISHVAVVVAYDEGTGRIATVGGNEGDEVSYKPSRSAPDYYIRLASEGTYSSLLAGCTSVASVAGVGESVSVPDGLGDVFSYEGWDRDNPDWDNNGNWSSGSAQRRLYDGYDWYFDDDGFAMLDGRYIVACTTTYGQVGDLIDFVLEDGTVISCVMGDAKSQSDDGCNKWGHRDGRCIIEFCVSYDLWYAGDGSSALASVEGNGQCIVEAVNYGSVFDGAEAGTTELASCSASLS